MINSLNLIKYNKKKMNTENEDYKIETKIENNSLQISVQDTKNQNEYIGLFSKEFLSEKKNFSNISN